jgi:hypothetical protein
MKKLQIKATTCEWMRRVSLVLSIATFMFFWFSGFSGAKSGVKWRDLSEAGIALWIFLILGAIIILLQLIPAIIMFFSLIGTGVHTGYNVVQEGTDKEKVVQDEVKEAD